MWCWNTRNRSFINCFALVRYDIVRFPFQRNLCTHKRDVTLTITKEKKYCIDSFSPGPAQVAKESYIS